MKKFTLTMVVFMLTCAAWAQDVCYLIGNNGIFKANRASATLKKQKTGVFAGEARFTNGVEFIVATKLASTENDWNSIQSYCWSAEGNIWVGHEKDMSLWNGGEKTIFGSMGDNRLCWVKVWVTDGQGSGKICIYKQKEDDPDSELEEPEDPENPDIDLSTGAHFTITLQEPGTLKQRLTNAVFQTDYDLVDFLTVKGKLGGADLVYLHAQEGLVSQLQYLDLSDVELVYDDVEYYSNTYQTNWGSFGGFQTYQTDAYTLSAENKDEEGESSFTGTSSNNTTIHRRNNLAHAFSGMQYLKQCKLPKTMTGVGESILEGCPLVKVTLPTAPAYIWGEAFNGTQLKTIELPATVEFIGDNAFRGVPLTTIDVSHVTSIGDYCFTGSSLKSIQLSNQLKKISNAMLAGTQIAAIEIPASVTEIGDEAFSGTKLRTVDIPASVTEIGAKAFYGCMQLGSVTMGNGVKKIGEEAFRDCGILADMTLSNNVEEIGNQAFVGVPWYDNLAAEDGVKYIGKVAYEHVSGTMLNIKEGTIVIADEFINTNLGLISSITLPSTLHILGKACFSGANISSIELPESLGKIGIDAFYNCNKLRRITIPKNVTYIGSGAFDGSALVRVIYDAENARSYYYENGEEKEEGLVFSVFPESVTRLIINEGVKSIPSSLFYNCKNLVRVQMPSTVERIGSSAFSGCTALTTIDLPSSLNYLGVGSFSGCNLSSVSVYMTTPLNVMTFPDEDELKEILEWQPGEETSTNTGAGSPFGSVQLAAYIDADGNVTYGKVTGTWDKQNNKWNYEVQEGVYEVDNPLPLLKVPNGALAAYQGDGAWSALFQKIEQFDGASSTEAVNETTTVSVSNTVTDKTDLTSTMLGSIYVTLDTEDSGDGYNASEGCIIINSTTNDEGLAAATADGADDLTVKNLFNGLIFEVPAGKGSVVVDCQTLGQNVIFVKIGSGEPKQVEAATKQQVTVPYEVSEITRIYVYADKSKNNAARQQILDDVDVDVAAVKARRANAYANDDAVKIYGLTINVDKDPSGITALKAGEYDGTVRKVFSNGRFYIIQPDGRKYTVDGMEVQ